MSNQYVGDVYLKIIEDVVSASVTDFEETGVSQTTLNELQQEWQAKLSQRAVAQMPWDPKPVQPSPNPPTALPSSATSNNIPPSYANHERSHSNAATNGSQIKAEANAEPQYNGLPNGYPQPVQPQGGLARAQHLVQQYPGNAMQRAGGGLALPGQQQQAKPPPGLQLPAQSPPLAQQPYSPQQQQAYARQQQQMQPQQGQPRIKVENESPQLPQGSFQQPVAPNYTQTDGANDAMEQWQAMLAERRAISADQRQQADDMMRRHVLQMSADLQSGLMVPLDEQPSSKRRKRIATTFASSSAGPAIPQLDGDLDDDDVKEEVKPDIKDEDDENLINSDLDDTDDEGEGPLGDDEDENGDSILCTYDKVQRVKNKWKCTLKDGVMSVNGKEWVFHKGMGEFEW